MTWKEGANDRLRIIGGGSGAEAFSGEAARYGDFVILGNVVLLCEGVDSVQTLDRCSALIEAVQNPGGSETDRLGHAWSRHRHAHLTRLAAYAVTISRCASTRSSSGFVPNCSHSVSLGA